MVIDIKEVAVRIRTDCFPVMNRKCLPFWVKTLEYLMSFCCIRIR